MAEENKSLDETDAGKELHAEIVKERKKFEKSLAEVKKQTLEALEDKDKESAKALKEMQVDYKDQIKRLERQGKSLKTDLEEMQERKYRQMEARLLEAERRYEQAFRQMDRDRSQKETELLREKEAAEQREKEASSALKRLRLGNNAFEAQDAQGSRLKQTAPYAAQYYQAKRPRKP